MSQSASLFLSVQTFRFFLAFIVAKLRGVAVWGWGNLYFTYMYFSPWSVC